MRLHLYKSDQTVYLGNSSPGRVFESHCTDDDITVGGHTPLQNDQAVSVTTGSSVKAAHIVDAEIDYCEKVRFSKLSSVNAALKEFNLLCPIYDLNNGAMEERFISTIIFAKGLAMGLDNPIFKKW